MQNFTVTNRHSLIEEWEDQRLHSSNHPSLSEVNAHQNQSHCLILWSKPIAFFCLYSPPVWRIHNCPQQRFNFFDPILTHLLLFLFFAFPNFPYLVKAHYSLQRQRKPLPLSKASLLYSLYYTNLLWYIFYILIYC